VSRCRRVVILATGTYSDKRPPSEPVLWISEQPATSLGALMSKLADRFEEPGLWPLALESLSRGAHGTPRCRRTALTAAVIRRERECKRYSDRNCDCETR